MSIIVSAFRNAVLNWLPCGLFMRGYAWYAYWRGEPELRVISQLVDPGDEAIDVGANYGVYAYHLSRFASRVHAYEPNPMLAARLRKAVPANVTVHEAALSDVSGDASLHVPLYADGRHMHGCAKVLQSADGDDVVVHSIKLNRLDDADVGQVGFIKIDVEGHEESVIRGAIRLIERCKPNLLIEIEQRHIKKSVGDVVAYIESLGYRAHILIRNSALTLNTSGNADKLSFLEPAARVLDNEESKDSPLNFIFIHQSRLPR